MISRGDMASNIITLNIIYRIVLQETLDSSLWTHLGITEGCEDRVIFTWIRVAQKPALLKVPLAVVSKLQNPE